MKDKIIAQIAFGLSFFILGILILRFQLKDFRENMNKGDKGFYSFVYILRTLLLGGNLIGLIFITLGTGILINVFIGFL